MIIIFVHLFLIHWRRVGILSTHGFDLSWYGLLIFSICFELLVSNLICLDCLVLQTSLHSCSISCLRSLLIEGLMYLLQLFELLLMSLSILTIIPFQFLLLGILHFLYGFSTICQGIWPNCRFGSCQSFLGLCLRLQNTIKFLSGFLRSRRRCLLLRCKAKIRIHLVDMHLQLLPCIGANLFQLKRLIVLTFKQLQIPLYILSKVIRNLFSVFQILNLLGHQRKYL